MKTFYVGYEDGMPQDDQHVITVVQFDQDGEYPALRYDWRQKQFVWDQFVPKYLMHIAPMQQINEQDVQKYIDIINASAQRTHPDL